jgi:hypothetical protein
MFTSRTTFVALLSGSLIAALVGVSTGRAALPTRTAGGDMLVLIDGCDGFVAPGGLVPNAVAPFPSSWTHNFLVTWADRSQVRFPDDPTGARTQTVIALNADGSDDGGHSFTIKGKLTLSFFADPLFWADGGTVKIRRDDGATVTGTAQGVFEHAFDPIFTTPDEIFEVTATTCNL